MSNSAKKKLGTILILIGLAPIKLAISQLEWWFFTILFVGIGILLLSNSYANSIEDNS